MECSGSRIKGTSCEYHLSGEGRAYPWHHCTGGHTLPGRSTWRGGIIAHRVHS